MKHEIDEYSLRVLVEALGQLKHIKITITPESLSHLERIVKGTIFWKGDKL